ncbi:glycoside hydrolase family 15 protein [Candidatus Lucifugimonas marina]|uniref:glycoside hydrolase family 15 protein n=1 Tax=Candidatus Lucifugimonas marina TaxID=3038979 RepID=UPI0027997195|nr:glycoside hydrolase family 15 protein [SAR202 cluster bacterium JH545]
MTYKRIEDYGLIGNMHTAALVGNDGSIDWLCLPFFDSPAIFNSILDDDKGGRFSISAVDAVDNRQIYFPETNILITRFGSDHSAAQVTDFMPGHEEHDPAGDPWTGDSGDICCSDSKVIRLVHGVLGKTNMRMECTPAFEFAGTGHQVERTSNGVVFTSDAGQKLSLTANCEFDIENGSAFANFALDHGESIAFVLEQLESSSATPTSFTADEADEQFKETVEFWRDWVSKCTYQGRWREEVIRSLLALKLLTFSPTGAIIAAPTASLPEEIGGERNWDYRYCWIRDAALTIDAFMRMGYVDEARGFMRWLGSRTRESNGSSDSPLQIMYGIRGEHQLEEKTLDHLSGYRDSQPVRIGNGAYDQFQLDIYGELMESVYIYNRHGWPISYDMWMSLSGILDWVAGNWQRPDEGIWEVRGGRKHFVHSKLMAWNALAKGLKLADERSFPANRDLWISARDEIFHEIMDKGWNEEIQSFTQSYGSSVVDAALLQLLNIGVLSPRDPRMISTLKRIEETLVRDSLVYRYDPEESLDGLSGTEGTFTMCTFWLAESYTRAGRLDDARFLFERMIGYASPLGLFAEETGPTGDMLGNFPQAFTHLALINSAFILNRALDQQQS